MRKTTTKKKKTAVARPKSSLTTGKGSPEKKRKNLVSQIDGEVPTLSDYLAPSEKEYIQKVIDDCAGNLVQASLILDVARNTLKSKLKKHKIKLPK